MRGQGRGRGVVVDCQDSGWQCRQACCAEIGTLTDLPIRLLLGEAYVGVPTQKALGAAAKAAVPQ